MHLRYLINDEESFELLLQHLREEPIWAYDCETNGEFSRFKVNLVGLSFGFDNFACYIPLMHDEGKQLPIGYVIDKLKPIFEDENSCYVAHNAKFDETVLKVYGIEPQGIGHDTFIMAWLFTDIRHESRGLKQLTKRLLHVDMETYEDVIAAAPKQRGIDRDFNFARVPIDSALSYAADDAYYTLQLYRRFYPQLVEEKLDQAYEHIERPCIRVLRDMEFLGINIDMDYMNYADEALPRIREDVEAAIYEKAGRSFNIASGIKLGRILFKEMKIGTNVPTTDTGRYKTDEKTLELYASKHKIVNDVLRYKKITKTHGTFVEGMRKRIERDGRIHASFNQAGTVTARLSSSNPNLQNIQNDEVEEVKVRDLFCPSEGLVFVVADYSQIELRMLAHFSKDEKMIEALTSGRDFHDEVARRIFDLNRRGTPRERLVAKTLNFGVPYGRGPMSVAEQLNCSMDEGKQFITDWFAQFPKVLPYRNDILIPKARRDGFIRTVAGRKRRLLPDIRSSDNKVRFGAERQAFNSQFQGSAADIIKLAMISLKEPLEELGARIILQVHDELVVESKRDNVDNVVKVMKKVMEHPLEGKNPLRLPLVVKPKIVERWSDAK